MAKTLSFGRSITPDNPIQPEELRTAERSLARLIAAAYAAEHPEEFAGRRDESSYDTQPSMEARLDFLTVEDREGNQAAGGTHGGLE